MENSGAAAAWLIWYSSERLRSHLGAHLCHKPFKHRVRGPSAEGVDRRLPHLPPFYQALAEQRSAQLEIESAVFLERTKLLEVVELPVQDVRLGRILGDDP